MKYNHLQIITKIYKSNDLVTKLCRFMSIFGYFNVLTKS